MSDASSQQPSCADALVGTLLRHGLDRVYCVPGIQNDGFFNALYDAGPAVSAIHARHEQGAAYMALGAALATGRPQVLSVVPGPGILNATAALATAYSTGAPVLCLAGQIASRQIGGGLGALHEIPDQLGILQRLTKRAERASDPATAATMLAGAIRDLTAGRPRPIALEIPPDILTSTGPFEASGPIAAAAEPEPDAGQITEAAAMLAASRRPLIIVGAGAQDSAAEVRALAERLQAPVLAHRMGRGVLDDRHPLAVTLPVGHRLWGDCDLLLVIGSRGQTPLGQWGADEGLKVIQIDIDPDEMARGRAPDLGLLGRVEAVLPKLVAEVDRLADTRPDRAAETASLKAGIHRAMAAALDPQIPFLTAIREAIGEEGVFVDELTQCGYVARIAYPVYRPRSYVSTGYQGTLGWGYATVLGVQDARRDVPVVSISGDGGFMFTMPEIATAVRHQIPLVAIVFNDGAYGNVRRMQQDLYGGRLIASDLANPDFVALGRSFGIAAERVTTPDALRKAVSQAVDRREPTLIEVPVGPMPEPWPFIQLPRLRGHALPRSPA